MPLVSVDIPEQALPDLKRIVDLDDAHFSSLIAAISETAPSLTRDQFFKKLSGQIDLPAEDILAILRAAFALYNAKERAGCSSQEMSESIVNSPTVSAAPDFPSEKKDTLRSRLALLLGIDHSLGISVKALDVMTEHERIFCNARILSDIRPVFTDKLESAAAVIIHMLQIGYHRGGQHREYYFALDTDDIRKLKDVIERAEKKAIALQAILKKAEVNYLEV